jgi:hypothetical protein
MHSKIETMDHRGRIREDWHWIGRWTGVLDGCSDISLATPARSALINHEESIEQIDVAYASR